MKDRLQNMKRIVAVILVREAGNRCFVAHPGALLHGHSSMRSTQRIIKIDPIEQPKNHIQHRPTQLLRRLQIILHAAKNAPISRSGALLPEKPRP